MEEVDLVFMDKSEQHVFAHEHAEFQVEAGESTKSGKEGEDYAYKEKV